MESLFDDHFVNKKPLRKYEPLIRFDVDGKPQPRRLIDRSKLDNQGEEASVFNSMADKRESNLSTNKTVNSKDSDIKPTTITPLFTSSKPNVESTPREHTEDLKRKIPHPPAKGVEPMKKKLPPTQKSITSFFTKKP